MATTTGGARRPLANAFVYSLVQRALGAAAVRRRFLADHVRPVSGERVLDLGCGPGDIVELLPDVRYVGVDTSEAYVEAARRRFGSRAEFICGDVSDSSLDASREFDVVMSIGFLHHLDDDAAADVTRLAARLLAPRGRFVSIDPGLATRQSRVARWLIAHDRGHRVRTPDGYRRLAAEHFGVAQVAVHHDLARVPYTHVVLECRYPQRAA